MLWGGGCVCDLRKRRDDRTVAIAALALVMAAGLLIMQPGGLTGAPTWDGGVAVLNAWPPSGDTVFAWLLSEYAFAQVQDSTLPTFVSSDLHAGTGVLSITFSEDIDATPKTEVDTSKIHIRESGTYTGGVTLTVTELDTNTDGTTISFTLTASHNATVAGLTTPELTIEPGAVSDIAGNPIMSTFDVSTASWVDATPVRAQDDNPSGMAFSSNGTKMFVVGNDGNDINEYNLTSPWDASTRTFVDATSVRTQDHTPTGMAFSSNGTKMFVVGSGGIDINEYNLTSPWDASTRTFVDATDVRAQDFILTGMAFSSNGTKMFVVGEFYNHINEYNLTSPWDASTRTFVGAFDVSGQEAVPQGMAFSSDGTKMFVVGSAGIDINEYNLSSPWGVSNADFVDAFDVSGQEASPRGMAFSSDGTKMFVVGNDGVEINEYALSSVYPITMISATGTDAFITTWQTTSAGESITIPVGDATGNYTVHWGDDITSTHITDATHTYDLAGNYTVSISGDFTRINLGGDTTMNADKLKSIEHWGDISWTTMQDAFREATKMTYNATDTPDLSAVTSMQNMFRHAEKFNGNLSDWDVSGVENMDGTFRGASIFNGDLSGWDTSGSNNMQKMFQANQHFNGDLSGWDTSGVTNMQDMFSAASDFNGDISGWNVSAVTNMKGMFLNTLNFNQNLSGWNVSKVTDMRSMFNTAISFNQNLSGWDVSNVTDMDNMFNGASIFNGDLSDWNVSKVTDMSDMFSNAINFNQNLSDWNVLNVTDMHNMFTTATDFDGDISGWNVSKVTDMQYMFNAAASFNGDLSGWNVSKVTDMSNMFLDALSFDQNLGPWYITPDSVDFPYVDSLNVTDITPQNDVLAGHNPVYGIGTGGNFELFEIVSGSDTLAFKAAPTSIGVYNANVTATEGTVFENGNNYRMIQITVSEIQPDDESSLTVGAFVTTWETTLSHPTIKIPVEVHSGKDFTIDWGDGSTTTVIANGIQSHTYGTAGFYRVTMTGDLSRIDIGASGSTPALLHSINQWGDIKWSNMNGAFGGATTMTYNATDTPDLSRVTDMSFMFSYTDAFNGDISNWNTSSVINMSSMFNDADAFNGDIPDWDTSAVTNMSYMFSYADNFNGDISNWNTSSVTNMSYMFTSADNFNGDISNWNTSSVTLMIDMFSYTDAFNGDISNWNTSSVTSMSHMFNHAAVFTGDLSEWDVSKVTNMSNMFDGAAVFTGDLSEWDVSKVTNMSHMFDGAAVFTGDLSEWDVSKVTDMDDMFTGADAFDQNLGPWYITPDSVDFPYVDSLNVTDITPQNDVLARHNPVYGIGTGGNFELFEIVSGSNILAFKEAPTSKGVYDANVTAAGDSVFENGNNYRMVQVTVSSIPIDPDSFLTTWKTTSAGQTIKIRVEVHSGETLTIDWDDYSAPTTVTANGVQSHTYDTAGSYRVAMTGDLSRIHLGVSGSTPALLHSINQWGDIKWSNMNEAFRNANRMTYNAADTPDLSQVTDMSGMFRSTSFSADLSTWNVSSVTDTSRMFQSSSFDGNISTWDVSQVQNMRSMFSSASSFDQPINAWNTSSVTNMAYMFYDADRFNQDLDAWTVSSVETMEYMFGSSNTNAAFNGNISAWDVSSVTNMGYMFNGASSFDQPLNDWNVSQVQNMRSMFLSASSFDRPLDDWNISSVTDMNNMFFNAADFDQNLGPWYITPDSVDFSYVDSLNVTDITPQNNVLAGHNPVYDIVAGGNFTLFEIASGSDTLAFKATPTSNGLHQVNVTAAGSSVFENGNNHRMVQVAVSGIQIDSTPPNLISISRDTPSTVHTSATTLVFNATFNEPVTNVGVADFAVTGTGTGTVFGVSGDGASYLVTVTVGSDGTIGLDIASGHDITDTAGNPLTTTAVTPDPDESFTVDTAQFTPSISANVTSPTNQQSIKFTVNFTEEIDPATFTVSDIDESQGTVSTPTTDDNQTFEFTITGLAEGILTVSIPVNTVDDLAQNKNIVSNTVTITIDTTAPSLSSISRGSPTTELTSDTSLEFAVDFSESVTGVDTSDFVVSGNGTGSVSGISGSGSSYTVTVGVTSNSGTIGLDLVANNHGIIDSAGTALTDTSPDTDETYTIDAISPSLTSITRHSPTAAITSETNLNFTVTFSEPVINVGPTDFVLSSGTGTITVVPTNASSYVVTVAVAADGIINLDVASGHNITDNVGNPLAATAPNPDDSFTVDTTQFTPSISTDTASTTNQQSITFEVNFGEPINATTFTASDIDESQGTVSAPATTDNQKFVFDITGLTEGPLTVSIPADTVDDLAENKNLASDILEFTIDTTAPSLSSISRDSPAAELTSETSLDFAVDFSESVVNVDSDYFVLSSGTGFGTGDITVSTVNASSYVVTVADATDGIIDLSVASVHDITDIAGNPLTATAPNPDDSFTVDTTPPEPSIDTDTASPTNLQSITFTVNFGEEIDPDTFTESDVDVSLGTVSAPATNDNQTFTFEITGLATGNLTVSIPAGSVDDLAENSNLASNTLAIVVDTTAPSLSSITRSSPTVEVTSLTSLEFAVDFSEAVTNVNATDFSVTGTGTGTISGVSGGGASYLVTVMVGSDGTIGLDIASGHDITDTVGNALPAVATPDDTEESFTVDSTRFTPLISANVTSPTNQQSIKFTVDFGEPINATTFTASDIDESQGTVSTPTTNNNQKFTFEITGLVEGTLAVSIPADSVDDLAQNKNLESDPTTIIIDTTAPLLSSITKSSPTSALTYLTSLDFAVVFNESVINVNPADFAVTGTGTGTVSGVSSNGDGASYTVTVAVDSIGIIGLDIAPGHDIRDAAQNSLVDPTATGSDETYTAVDDSLFLTTWETTAANPIVGIPVEVHSGETFTIDWGDGNTTEVNSNGVQSHTYATAGSYWVIMAGDLSRINLGGSGSTPALLDSINQWGDIQWSTMNNAFRGASAMTYHATDTPNLSQVTDMSGMFRLATAFNGDISGWNTSSVTDMSHTFSGANAFNKSLVGWNTSSVTDMSNMFYFARAFNGDISDWNTSSVTNMSQMFDSADTFNGDISGWNTSSVTDMSGMFDFAEKFNRDISGWNVSSVTNMDDMFDHADDFDQNLGPWYITPDSVDFSYVDSLNVTDITPQNDALAGHNPVYDIGTGGNFTLFEIVSGSDTLAFKGIPTSTGVYNVNVTASDGTVFEDGNNHRVIRVTVSDILTDRTPPRVASILRDTPSTESTTATTLVFAVTFDEPVTNVDAADFEVTGNGTGTVSGVSGDDGASYQVTVTVDGVGTIGLDIASDHDIQDAANNDLANLTPTGDDETYTVTDSTPPRVTSILRDTPSVASTTATTLVFNVTFNEPVINVGVADFDVAGNGTGSISNVSGSGTSYTVTVAVTGAGIIGLDIASGHDIQDTANNDLANLAPTGDDEIYTVTETTVTDNTPPRVTSILRNTPLAESTTATTLVFAVTFDEPVTNVNTADFTVAGNGTGTIFNVSGSGASYTVTVAVTAVGTIGLDIASDHDIQDAANNDLANLTPTGDDETYTVTETTVPDNTPPRVASILRNTPLAESTTATTLVFAVTFDEPVTNVDAADFALTGTGTGTVSAVSGSGASYEVTVTEATVGTIGLDIATGHNIQDAATNDLTDLTPTGNDETYTVTVVDNTPPRVASILRNTPLAESTSDTTLVFAVTFDESVINVNDAADFTVTGNGTGTISGISGSGASYTVTVTVTASGTIGLDIAPGHDIQDAATNGLTDTTVVGSNEAYIVNQLPVLNNIPSQTGDELTPLTFTAEATDRDNDPLTYSLIEPIPDGATMDTNTGVFSWTPTETQDGIHTITVQVSDGNGGGTDLQDVAITVTEVNQNPVLDSIGGQTIDETDTLKFDATARDDDIYQGSPNSLTFSLGDGADRPRGASITRDGSFSWRPDQSQDGVYSINVTVSDGRGGTTSELISVTVRDIAPSLVSVRGSGSSITLTLSEPVISSETGHNGFTVLSSSSNSTVIVESITGSGTDTLALLLDGPLSRGDTLSYDSSTGDIVDESGKPLESFVDVAIILLESKKSGTAPPSVNTLEINGQSYNAQNRVNHATTPLEVAVDQPISMSFTVHDRLDILYFAVYLNLQDDDTSYTNSDTYVEYNRGKTNIVDPQNLLSDASLTISPDPDDSTEKTVTLGITFAEVIGDTNMVIRTWNADRQSSIVIIVDALNVISLEVDPEPQVAGVDPEPQVTGVDPEPQVPAVPNPEPGTETFADDFDYDRALFVLRMWSGFESEIADDNQLLAVMGLTHMGTDIPAWVMTDLAPLVVKELITLDEFRVALEYVMGNT